MLNSPSILYLQASSLSGWLIWSCLLMEDGSLVYFLHRIAIHASRRSTVLSQQRAPRRVDTRITYMANA